MCRASRRRDVFAWVLADPAVIHEALGKLERALSGWDELCRDVNAAIPAGTFPAGHDDPPGSVRSALQEARQALAEFAEAIDEHAVAVQDSVAEENHTPARPQGDPGIQERLAALARADGRCRARLEHATGLLASDGTRPWLANPPARAALMRASMSLLDNPDQLRALLEGQRGDVVADLVDRYPAVGQALCEPWIAPPPMPADLMSAAYFGGANNVSSGSDPDAAAPLHRIADVRAFLSRQDPGTLRRWALLWPHWFGRLDGAPLPVRFVANRLLLRHALTGLANADRRYDEAESARRTAARSWPARLVLGIRTAWSSREVLAGLWSPAWVAQALARSEARTRIRLLQSLLHEPQDDGRPGAADVTSLEEWLPSGRRQVLMFDPIGRGLLAELRGRLDGSTRHLAVLVPGTGTAIRGFHMPAQFAADLVAADPDGTTAALAWMGCELPLAYGTESPLARFALAGAQPLCDLVAGLHVPAGVDVTAIGHSYGGVVVGAAERLGLLVDKVIHLASPGAGPGVRGVSDYPPVDALGRPRAVRRWSLRAPGDPVAWVSRIEPLRRWRVASRTRRWWPRRGGVWRFDLGVDPAALEGITVLPAGHWERDAAGFVAGTPLVGLAAHTGVTNPATTAFQRLIEVVRLP